MKKKRTKIEKGNDLWLSIQSKFKNSRAKMGGHTVTNTRRERILEHNKEKRALTDEQVIEAKELYRNDISIGFPELAEKYNVDVVTIHNMMNGKTYQDVGGSVTIRQPRMTCPHCDAPPMIKTNFTRFHGDKCKKKNS